MSGLIPSPELASDAARLVGSGVDKVFQYDNIAIVVLMVAVCFSGAFNILQWWTNNRDKKEFFQGFILINNTMNQLLTAVTILNVRLEHTGKGDGNG